MTHLAAKSSAVFLASCAEAGLETIAKRKSANNLEFIVASSVGSILTMQRFSKPKSIAQFVYVNALRGWPVAGGSIKTAAFVIYYDVVIIHSTSHRSCARC